MTALKTVVNCFMLNIWIALLCLAKADQIPSPVIRSSASVFRYIPLNLGESGEWTSSARRREKLEGECKRPLNFLSQLRCDYMRVECEGKEICRVPFVTSGSAFLVGDNNDLITAFHVAGAAELAQLNFLGPSLLNFSAEKRAQIFAAYRPEFMLYDSDGKKVYDTREEAEPHRFEFVGNPLKQFDTDRKGQLPMVLQGYALDFARIQLHRKIGEGLKVRAPSRADQVFWAVGFPEQTEGREAEYDGFNLYANAGLRHRLKTIADAYHFAVRTAMAEYPLLYCSNDIVGGFSGGPLLDPSGEVLGIITSTLSDEKSYQGAAFGVPWQDFSKFQIPRKNGLAVSRR